MKKVSRRARRDIISNICHVIVQGIEKEYIFDENIYKRKYYNLILENLDKYNIKLLAYCIMDNHTHLCLYYDNIEDLSKFMHKIDSDFARFYNFIKSRVGYVFRNRYFTQQILDRMQLFNTIAYIHNNPVKAGITENINQYEYSSYKKYEEGEITEDVLLIVFESIDYKETFYYMHKNYEEMDVADIDETVSKDSEDVINEYLEKNKISLNLIKKENNLLIELIKKLKIETKKTNKEIAKILGIDKNRMTRLYRKILD